MCDNIAYKIMTATETRQMHGDGAFQGSATDMIDGYIHLSTAAQLAGTLEKHFSGIEGLMLAAINLARLGNQLRWEPSRGGQLFPHLYGSLPIDAVTAIAPVKRLPDGTLALPT